MTLWLAGMRITASRLNDNALTETTTTGLTAATDWSVTSFSGRRVNGITTITVLCLRTGAAISEIATNSGNISDTLVATLPSGWRPPETMTTIWDNGSNDGSVIINTAGEITIRTTSGSNGVANNSTVRMTTQWISGNG